MNFISHIQYWLGEIPLPSQLDRSHRYMLHLFDTPSYTYYLLDQLLKQIQVVAVIHNGNLSSQLRLSEFPHHTKTYEDHLQLFANLLERHQLSELYICLSPEDHPPSIERILPFAVTFKSYGQVQICDLNCHFAYDANNLPAVKDTLCLTRKKSINFRNSRPEWTPSIKSNHYVELLDLETQTLWKLPYPHSSNAKFITAT